MKKAYPIIISKEEDGFFVDIPDFNIATQGKDIYDSIFMARDAMLLMGNTLNSEGKIIPQPSNVNDIKKKKDTDIITLVDVDFESNAK